MKETVFTVESGALRSNVGEFRNNRFQTTGKSGHLIYGPYIDLKAGKYSIIFTGRINSQPESIIFDVIASGITIASTAPISDGPIIGIINIDCGTDLRQVETRCYVENGCDAIIDFITIISENDEELLDQKSRSFLLPKPLIETKDSEKSKLAVLGTCLSEWLIEYSGDANIEFDHFIMESKEHAAIPNLKNKSYDAVVVHLTMRHIITDAIGEGDLFYLREPYSPDLTYKIFDKLKKFINRVLSETEASCPFFFLSFLEPPSSTKGRFQDGRNNSIYRIVRDINDELCSILSRQQSAYYIEINDIANDIGRNKFYDGYVSHFTHAAVDTATGSLFVRSVVEIIEQTLLSLTSDKIKLIVVDLDNTLWKGVAAEEDEIVDHLYREGWPIGFVEALLELKNRGILLAISSKNDIDSVKKSFDIIWGDRITLEDFVSVKANWKPKSENIFEIIKTCNILPQHTLFIDDNPIEISEVSSNIPGILTLTGNQAFWKMNLLYNSSTQAVTISEEAKNKTELVRAIEKRQTDESSMSRDEFLISLNLRVGLEKLGYNDSAQRSRCLELINKTNQFNTTGKKLTEAEFESLLSSANDIYYATASDKFGNHGIISVAIFQNGTITQMVLSCRVFGLGIEDFMIASIMSMHELNDLSFDFIKTTKNSSAKSFLDRFTELNDYTTIRIKKDMIKSPAWISKPH